MRVLVLTNLFPTPFQPNRALWNRQQIGALSSDCDVRVIAPVLWTDEWAARRRGERLPPGRQVTYDGILVDYLRYYYPPKVLRQCYGDFFRWSVQRTFERVVHEFAPDVVFAPWAYPDGWAAVELASRAGLPVVVKVHGSDILTLSRYPRRLRGTVEALQRAEAVVAVSRDLAERMTQLGIAEEKTHVVYNGIDTDLFSPGPRIAARRRLDLPQEERLVLFVGNLAPVKCVDMLLDSCARLQTAGERFHCRLVGDGPRRSSLAKQIDRLGLAGCVTLHGSRPHQELPDWYRAANVLVLPSRSEGVPNVLLEASACGLPFVATHVGGIPEIAQGRPCRLVPPGDAGRLADAVEAVLRGSVDNDSDATVCSRSWRESAVELRGVLETSTGRFISAGSVTARAAL